MLKNSDKALLQDAILLLDSFQIEQAAQNMRAVLQHDADAKQAHNKKMVDYIREKRKDNKMYCR